MKKLFVMLLSLLTLSFSACENEDSTIIEGQVIYEDTEEPVAGIKIYVSGEKTTGLMTPDKEITRNETFTDEDGQFSLSIAPHEEVTNYHLSVIPGAEFTDFDGAECFPETCNLLQPGKTHKLTIRVKRK